MPRRLVRRPLPATAPDLPQSLHPVLRRVYAARQVSGAGQLEYGLGAMQPWQGLAGIEAAVDLLEDALATGRRILVLGDFDADGATSSALMVRALRAFGAQQVDYLVPNRFEYGYGLTPEIVAVAAARGPDLLITVDNGISSLAGVQAARDAGMRVLVTDHHLPGAELPAAHAIVNPNQPGCGFASKNLAGVGVAFYVMAALRARLRESGWFRARGVPDPNLARLLDLVALGTVADVVPLDHNNRVLVAQGLARIRAGACCPGIAALLKVAGRDPARAVAADLGYAVGPRLNAAGRLQDMSLGIECLLADSATAALAGARRLDELNRERRVLESEMQEQALALLDDMHLDEGLPTGLCLFDEGWHQGVIGILASRIKDRHHRPVIAFAPAGNGELKGSARSVPGLHIRDALDAVAARHPGLIVRFGGHAMAAGLSLARENLAAFSRGFDQEVRRHLGEDDLLGRLHTDGELGAGDHCPELARALRGGGPWGQGFPEPVFEGVFPLLGRRVVGERHLKLSVRLPGQAGPGEAIAFNHLGEDWPSPVRRVLLAYRLDLNEYQGQTGVQLVVEHLEPLS
jgi:single-stranded-DNA-specific exonuclease